MPNILELDRVSDAFLRLGQLSDAGYLRPPDQTHPTLTPHRNAWAASVEIYSHGTESEILTIFWPLARPKIMLVQKRP